MNGLGAFLRSLLATPIGWLVSVKSIPNDLTNELGIDKTKPIVYLLQTKSFTDNIALEKSAAYLGLPAPRSKLNLAKQDYKRSYYLS
ncbi:MAG: glycerol-3-phosphate 1-O-acyltransferase, partial [Glaciecola sp.]